MQGNPLLIAEAQYTVDEAALPEGLEQSLQILLPVRTRPIVRRRLVLLDTFNGRIAAAGGRLTSYVEKGGTRLEWEPQDRQARLEVSVQTPVDFAWNLPGGLLRDSLEPIIAGRRLLPQVEVEIQGRMLDVLDDDRKTVARIRIEVAHARTQVNSRFWKRVPTLVTLIALRGYDAAFEKLRRIIESRPGLERCPDGLQSIVLQELGTSLPCDASQFSVELDRSVRADDGARQIHRALLDIMVANEPGMRADLDAEFLHNYRVSLRRTRSLLGQIKNVFPEDAVTHFRTEFRWLAHATSVKRDLDVLVLSVRRMSTSVPSDHLATLLAFLNRKQVHAQRLLEPLFESDRYKHLLASWRNFLQDATTGDPESEDAARSLIDVTSGHILRLHSRLFYQATAIHDETPVEAIHEVRIEANKLRYMIDATSSLYDRRDLDRMIDSLTRMQNVLGDFKDAQVQERNLLISEQALLESGEGEPGVLLTVRRLAENARNRALSLRPKVDRELSRFCRDDIRIDFRRLFNRDALVETSQ
jgi:CHAD domain-containing protein